MSVILISYRRPDSQDVAGRIHDRLVARYTAPNVLKDGDIPLGVSVTKHLQQVVSKASVVLVIIGPSWVNARDAQGRRRLDDPNDYVRMEVECALRGKMPVIPILVSGAQMPAAAELPPPLQELAARNGMTVRPDPDFNDDINRLISGIEKLDKLLQAQGASSNPRGEVFDAAVSAPPRTAPRPSQADREGRSESDQSRSQGKSEARGHGDRPEPANKGRSPLLLIGLIGGGVFCLLACMCVGVVALVLSRNPSSSGPDIIGRWELRLPDAIGGNPDGFVGTAYEFRRGGTGTFQGINTYSFTYQQNGDRVNIQPGPDAVFEMPKVLIVRRSNEFLFVREDGQIDELMLKKAF